MSKDRYIVKSIEVHGDYSNALIDSRDGRKVFMDGGAPEDQSLTRDLGDLVKELNAVAASLEIHATRAANLEVAIRKHRNARGHDRCWENDLDLYAVLGDEPPASPELPPREEFMAGCERYYDGQCGGSVKLDLPSLSKAPLKKTRSKTCHHGLCRPPEGAVDAERWTGTDWIPDDGKPGLCFSGKENRFPFAWYPEAAIGCKNRYETKLCVAELAGNRTADRFHCSNGRGVAVIAKAKK